MPEPLPQDLTLINIHEVCRLACLGTTTIYRLMNAGTFPLSFTVSPGCVRWLKAEVEEWIANKVTAPRALRVPPHKKAKQPADGARGS